MPAFNDSDRNLPHIMVDRVEMVIGDYCVYGDSLQVPDFLSRIGGIDVETLDGELVRVFNQPSITAAGRSFEADVSSVRHLTDDSHFR